MKLLHIIAVNHQNTAQLAAVQNFLCPRARHVIAHVERQRTHQARSICQIRQLRRFFFVQRKRLFTQHMLFVRKHITHNLPMRIRGRADMNHINFVCKRKLL